MLTTVLLFAMGWYVAHREQRIILQGNSKGLPFSSWEIWVIIVMFALIAGFRNYSSADMMMYHNQYTIYGIWGYFTRQLELGFSQVIVLFSSLGLHYYVFSVFWSAIEITLILYALRHKKQLYPWILFYVMCGPFFTYWMDQMRQIVVACVLLAMTPLIVKRRFWPFLMISLLCMFIHRSAWMMIPLYFVNRIHWLEKFNLKWVYGILAACIVIGLYPIWVRCFGSLSWICPYIGYEKYVRAVTALSLFDAHFSISQFDSVIYVSNLLLYAIILFHVPDIWRYYNNY
ncbi:MAG: EpsG family protein, partial [Muribaculaceae bacterium]|nr:EpsG family protein [Muribaculaceae bacterium]